MTLRTGNMWDHPAYLTLVTANQSINRRGELVMGRGAALEAMRRFPGCQKIFGSLIRKQKLLPYHLLLAWDLRLGLFQVKYKFNEKADLILIRRSTKMLCSISNLLPAEIFNLNYPGISAGWLAEKDVAPIIHELPNNVHVWKYL